MQRQVGCVQDAACLCAKRVRQRVLLGAYASRAAAITEAASAAAEAITEAALDAGSWTLTASGAGGSATAPTRVAGSTGRSTPCSQGGQEERQGGASDNIWGLVC